MYEREKSNEIYSSELVRKKTTTSDMETSFRDFPCILSRDENQNETHFLIEVYIREDTTMVTN